MMKPGMPLLQPDVAASTILNSLDNKVVAKNNLFIRQAKTITLTSDGWTSVAHTK